MTDNTETTQDRSTGLSSKVIVIGVGVVVIVGFVALMAVGLLSNEPVTGRSGVTRVGKPAPEFRLPLFEGGELEFSQSFGKPTVINFWASWCPPCREESPLLERTWRAFKDSGVQFIGVDIQDSEEDARAYISEFGITFPNGLDADGRITIDYGVIGLPVTFFVSSDGIVQRRWVGAIRENRLVPWIEELVANQPPSGDTEGQNLDSFFELN
ncbi:MAG: TlpA family protein disulfide reductase [Chloroflexi bacterium]|nr:TlpA family protein disulfide reductase [Chloroflexota bacterium]